ncbi:hypothetical protein AB0K21_21695 [Streptosporangium sp. NPDC049248]|uniref:hypothetical protein n=1 Tax=Streptosporangium sp. NPDC049248 TaxID=3155651 RepID=UPI00344A7046
MSEQKPKLTPWQILNWIMQAPAAGLSVDRAEGLAAHVVQELEMYGLAIVPRSRYKERDETPPPPPMIYAGMSASLNDLVPGRVVQRWAIAAGETVSVEPPCCAVLGRRIVLPNEEGHEDDVVCQYDRLRYTVRLVDDGDEGLWAYLTVVGAITVTKARPPRRKATR